MIEWIIPALCRQPFPGHDGGPVSQHLGYMDDY